MNEAEAARDAARGSLGFLSLAETTALSHRGVLIPEPGSVLISADVQLHDGVTLWPNVIL